METHIDIIYNCIMLSEGSIIERDIVQKVFDNAKDIEYNVIKKAVHEKMKGLYHINKIIVVGRIKQTGDWIFKVNKENS